jgi:hypothetical protein
LGVVVDVLLGRNNVVEHRADIVEEGLAVERLPPPNLGQDRFQRGVI